MTARVARTTLAIALVVGASTAACNSVLSIHPPDPTPPAELDAGRDATLDGGPNGGGDGGTDASDAGLTNDANDEGDASDASDAPDPYFPLGDLNRWTWLDLQGDAATASFAGAAFDGRYLYTPAGSMPFQVARYDTRGSFTLGDWSFGVVDPAHEYALFSGAIFNGTSVSFVPFVSAQAVVTSVTPLADGGADAQDSPFGATSTVDLATLSDPVSGYFGGVALALAPAVDTPILLAPGFIGGGLDRVPSGNVALFDGVWHFHDLAAADDGAVDFAGAVFDGRSVFFVPAMADKTKHPNRAFLKLDTKYHPVLLDSFDDPAAWQTVPVATIAPGTSGFFGGAFDGRYVYYLPSTDGNVLQFDTTKPFDDHDAWKAVDLAAHVDPAARGYRNGAFDGRYLYFIPTYLNSAGAPSRTSLLVRFDTRRTFEPGDAFESFDVSGVNPHVKGFFGSVFDGKFLYLIPNQHGIFLRFEARSSPQMPSGFRGSFY